MTTSIRVCAAGPAHAALLTGLHNEMLQAEWTADSVARLLNLPGAFGVVAVTDKNERPLGFALCIPGGEGLDIAAIGVAADVRRQGIGRLVMDEVVARAEAAGCRELVLEVGAGNKAARHLYLSCGFSSVAERQDYYAPRAGKPGESALVMKKTLPT